MFSMLNGALEVGGRIVFALILMYVLKMGFWGSVVYEYIYMDCDSTHRICEIFCVYKKVSERR